MKPGSGLDRRGLVAAVLRHRGDAAVIAGLGSPAWDCHAAGDSPLNFYFWGAMGGASMLGLGVALTRPRRRVLVITGDAELLMGIGSLATIAAQAPANLSILALDNEAFGETGRQAGLTGKSTDIAAMARGAGIRTAFTVVRDGAQGSAVATASNVLAPALFKLPGPVVCVAKVDLTTEPSSFPPREGPLLRDRFRAALSSGGPTDRSRLRG
ncbi:thiamine pyrophosphate-dependent enzyme [Candidatus Palauibacter sp.]|uniref:thiamine pyrophosphate-dependent enzyme n=1 Tax=Candidatus Palauibacter sp. TaxID=3101350 RepID=UPI003CC552B8